MEWWQAIVFGIVEGLTEYLPVSSTGHLILAQKLMRLPDSAAVRAFEIVIQAGAILAVVGVYSNRVKQLILGIFGQSPAGFALAVRLVVAFLPAAILGLALEQFIDKTNLVVVSSAWIVGGVAILGVESWRRRRDPNTGADVATMSIGAAFVIGLMQTLALCPGVSRSLVCLLGGLIVGMRFAAALEFSFLLGGLTLFVASGYKAFKYRQELVQEITPLAVVLGLATSAFAAFVTVRWMIRSLERSGLNVFGYYRIAPGLIVLTLIAMWLL